MRRRAWLQSPALECLHSQSLAGHVASRPVHASAQAPSTHRRTYHAVQSHTPGARYAHDVLTVLCQLPSIMRGSI